mgnify:CR=1 FL=1
MGWRTWRGGRRRDSGDGRLTDAVPALSVIRAVETLTRSPPLGRPKGGVGQTDRHRQASRPTFGARRFFGKWPKCGQTGFIL